VSSIDPCDALWRKSSYSNGQANCVEAAVDMQGCRFVAVRDSKAPNVSKLIFAAPVWQRFVTTVKALARNLLARYSSSERLLLIDLDR
jgi:hypothetical protein